MAVYKVPQDVEADDKLIGPFSFKQFVFILIAVGILWFTYVLARVTPIFGLLAILAVPFLILGLPLRKEQPTDVYIAALINFALRPKVRTWNQEGMVDHVNVTAPKKVTRNYGDGLSRTEVQSRLSSLASTMDTRGWSAKNVDPITAQAMIEQSDRLVNPVSMPQQIPEEEGVVDIMDARSSAVAQNFARLEAESAAQRGDISAAQALSTNEDETPKQVLPGTVVMPELGSNNQQPAQPRAPQPPQDLRVGAPNYNAYPQLKQNKIDPVHSRDQIAQPGTPPTDIINNNSPSSSGDINHLEGDGEIPLR